MSSETYSAMKILVTRSSC